uniref:Gag-pro n=1 Tax=Solanum tuberosum TaxID=4113 RepID=M1DGW6_SOLTU
MTPQDEALGPLRRKREDVSSISFESSQKSKRHAGLNVPKSLPSKTYPLAPQNPYLIKPNYQTPPPNHPNYQAPLPNYPNAPHSYQAPQYQNFQTPAPTRQNPPSYRQVHLPSRNNYNLSCHEYLKKPSRVFTPLVESRTQLFERLKADGLIRTIDPKNVNVNSRLYRPNLHCAYHSGGAGHTTEDCINLKHKIQDLIDQRIVTLQTGASNASGDSLWNRGGFTINMIDPKSQAPPRQNAPYHHQLPFPQHGGQYDPPRSRFEKKPARKFTPLIESRTKLFERLTAADFIHLVGPKPVDTSSKFYRADRRCAYHSNSVGHDTEDCINLKHKIQDLIDQRVVTLQTATPSVNSNPPLNYGKATINMIETEEEWCTTKAIVPAGPDNLERVIASSSMNEKLNFTSVTPHQAFALVSREGQNKKGINRVPPKSLPHFCQSFLVEEYANDDDFGEGIGDRCEEGDVAPKKMIETPSIRDAEPMEQVLNWTSTPLLIPRSS